MCLQMFVYFLFGVRVEFSINIQFLVGCFYFGSALLSLMILFWRLLFMLLSEIKMMYLLELKLQFFIEFEFQKLLMSEHISNEFKKMKLFSRR